MGGERGQQGSVVPWPGASAWLPHSTLLPSPWGNRASFPYAGAFHVPSGSWERPGLNQRWARSSLFPPTPRPLCPISAPFARRHRAPPRPHSHVLSAGAGAAQAWQPEGGQSSSVLGLRWGTVGALSFRGKRRRGPAPLPPQTRGPRTGRAPPTWDPLRRC